MRVIAGPGNQVIYIEDDHLEMYIDGKQVLAAPEDTDAYRATAARLGYGADTWAMCREHDPLHIVLCDVLGLQGSPALAAVARSESVTDLTGAEEDLVLAAQRFLNLARAAGLVPETGPGTDAADPWHLGYSI